MLKSCLDSKQIPEANAQMPSASGKRDSIPSKTELQVFLAQISLNHKKTLLFTLK
jgi:hypothetical protein